jgi:hypothetical protein
MSRVTKPDKSVSPKPAVKLEKSIENHFSIVHRFGFFETDRPVKPKQMRPVFSVLYKNWMFFKILFTASFSSCGKYGL